MPAPEQEKTRFAAFAPLAVGLFISAVAFACAAYAAWIGLQAVRAAATISAEAKDVRLQVTEAHLLSEEIAGSDTAIDMRFCAVHFDSAQAVLSLLSAGVSRLKGRFSMLVSPSIFRQIDQTSEALRQFRTLTEQYLDARAKGESIEPLRKASNAAFEEFSVVARRLEHEMLCNMNKGLNFLQRKQFWLILGSVVLAAFCWGFAGWYWKRQRHAMVELLETNRKLDAVNQQLRAVEQQLRASNQQLRAHEQQLRAANQQLRAANQELAANELIAHIQRDIAFELSVSHSISAAMETVLDGCLKLNGVDCGGIYLADTTSGSLNLVAYRGLSQEFVRAVCRYDRSAPQTQLVMQGKPIYRCYEELDFSNDEIKRAERLRAIAVIPIKHDDRVIAVLNMASRTSNDFDLRTRNALELVAASIGGSIVHMQAESALTALFQATPSTIGLLSHDGTIVRTNERLCELSG